MAELGTVTPKAKKRPDGRSDPAAGTSKDTNKKTPLPPKDPTEQPIERVKDLVIRIDIAKTETRSFIDRLDNFVTTYTPITSVLKAKLIGLNRHWETVARLH